MISVINLSANAPHTTRKKRMTRVGLVKGLVLGNTQELVSVCWSSISE